MDFGVSLLFFRKGGLIFPSLPTCDVAISARPGHSIQHPGSAEEPDMTSMERRDWPLDRHLFFRHELWDDFPPREGLSGQIFQFIEWETSISKVRSGC